MRAFALLVVVSLPALAAPREFPVTWTTRTAEVGAHGYEGWLTPRLSRESVDYLRMDARLAWVAGVAKNLESQLSLDLDWEKPDFRVATLDPRVSSLWRWTTWRAGSPVNVGGVGRLTLGFDSVEVEGRLLLDATVGRVLLALNGMGAQRVYWSGPGGSTSRLEASGGARFQVSPTTTFGLEVRARSSYREALYQGTALYAGPALAVTAGGFWVALGAYAQVASDKATADKGNGEHAELRDNERFVLRLTVGQRVR